MNDARFGIGPVDEVLDRLPLLSSKRRQHAEPLSGAGNRVYRLRLDGRDFVMRFPGRSRYITVQAEYDNQRRAAEAGVAPAAVGFDRQSGAIVSRWLAGDTHRSARHVDDDDNALAHCLARLHHGTAPFTDAIAPGRALRWNLTPSVQGDTRLIRLAARADERLRDLPASAWVNCHGDPTAGNVIGRSDDRPAPQLIDWEYSHRNVAAWDLAVACNDRGVDAGCARAFLAAYNAAAGAYGAPAVETSALEKLRGVTALAGAAWLMNHHGDEVSVNHAVELAAHWLD